MYKLTHYKTSNVPETQTLTKPPVDQTYLSIDSAYTVYLNYHSPTRDFALYIYTAMAGEDQHPFLVSAPRDKPSKTRCLQLNLDIPRNRPSVLDAGCLQTPY